jgi:hypothetical protein
MSVSAPLLPRLSGDAPVDESSPNYPHSVEMTDHFASSLGSGGGGGGITSAVSFSSCLPPSYPTPRQHSPSDDGGGFRTSLFARPLRCLSCHAMSGPALPCPALQSFPDTKRSDGARTRLHRIERREEMLSKLLGREPSALALALALALASIVTETPPTST